MIFQFSTPWLTCMLMSPHSAQPLKRCACVCACVRVLGQDRGKASLWFLSQQLQSQLVLSQPHVVFSPSLSTAARASKYLLYCTQAGRWRVGGWVGGGGVNVPGTFANH